MKNEKTKDLFDEILNKPYEKPFIVVSQHDKMVLDKYFVDHPNETPMCEYFALPYIL